MSQHSIILVVVSHICNCIRQNNCDMLFFEHIVQPYSWMYDILISQ